MLNQYRKALRTYRNVSIITFMVICAILIAVHVQRQKSTFTFYAFELGDAKNLTPSALTTRIRALIDARGVSSQQSGRRDPTRVDVRVLTPRSGPVVVLSARDQQAERNRKALDEIVRNLEQELATRDTAALSQLRIDERAAQSQVSHFANEISRLTTLREDALSRIRQLEKMTNPAAPHSPGNSVQDMHAAQIRSEILSSKVEYLTRIEEMLASAHISYDAAQAKLAAARAVVTAYKPSRRLYGPVIEPGEGFGVRSWLILLAGAFLVSFGVVPALLAKRPEDASTPE